MEESSRNNKLYAAYLEERARTLKGLFIEEVYDLFFCMGKIP